MTNQERFERLCAELERLERSTEEYYGQHRKLFVQWQRLVRRCQKLEEEIEQCWETIIQASPMRRTYPQGRRLRRHLSDPPLWN